MVDDAVVDVELGGLGVGLQVDEQLPDALDRLLGPATLRVLEGLALGVATNAARVPPEGDDLLVLEARVHVPDGLLEVPSLHRASHFVSVLIVGAQVGDSALRRCTQNQSSQTQVT